MKQIKNVVKLSIVERIRAVLFGDLPTQRIVRGSAWPAAEGSYIASNMTPERLHSILSSAEAGECSDLWDLYRDVLSADSHMQAEFAKRKLGTLCEVITAQPADADNPDDVAAAKVAQDMLDGIKNRVRVLSHMMDSILYPLSIVEKVYKPSSKPGLSYELKGLYPVAHRLINLKEGTVGIFETDDCGRKQTTGFEANPTSFIIHRNHILSSPDNWGGPMRCLLFWWLFGAMGFTWWAQWLERYGMPFLVGKYQAGDDESRAVLQTAFAMATRLFGLAITADTQVEIQNAAQGMNGDGYEKFLSICKREKSKLILGGSLSAEAQPTGMNSGQAQSQDSVRDDIRLFDCVMLAATIRDQLVEPFLQINGIKGSVPKIIIGGEAEADMTGTGVLLTALANAGLQVADDGIEVLSQRLNLRLERRPIAQVVPGGMTPFAADIPGRDDPISANAKIAQAGAAALGKAYQKVYDDIARALRLSNGPADFEARVSKICAGMNNAEITMLIQDVLNANIINGVSK